MFHVLTYDLNLYSWIVLVYWIKSVTAHLIFKPPTVLQLIEHSKKITDLSDHQDITIFFFAGTVAGKLSPT